jgi:peptidoglycan hydrolase CwlO-like protein
MDNITTQLAGLIEQQVKSEMANVRDEYRKKLDEELGKITAELKEEANRKIRLIAVAVIAVIVAAFAIFTYTQTQLSNKTFNDFQNSVMGLQKEVVASQNIILASHETITKAQRELSEKTGEIEALKSELAEKNRRLQDTAAEYEARLKALKEGR